MHGAQAEAVLPVAQAYAAGTDVCRPVKPDTIAKSLAIGNPADGPYAVDLARRTGGSVDAVSDDELRAGIRLLAETTYFMETAGGVTTATLAKLAARGEIGAGDRVVAYITGDGLKTLDAVRGSFEVADIEPRFEAFEAIEGGATGRWRSRSSSRPSCAASPAAPPRRRPTAARWGRCSEGLYAQHGELRDRIAGDDGELRRFVNVYLKGEDIRFLDGLATPVADGDEVTILPAVAGG